MKPLNITPTLIRLVTALSLVAGTFVTWATPYATSLTNDAGVVSFRLNMDTATNDTVLVISSGGTVTNVLQSPADAPANVITRGLIVTNLGIAAGTFQVYVKHVGSGVISTNSPRVLFGNATITGVRGLAANANPASPYFGRVYVANSQTNFNNLTNASRGDGLFAFSADIGSATSDILGQGNVPRNGGYNFGSVAIGVLTNQQASSPFKISVAPDDSVLVSDWSDATGNLISLDPDLTTFSYVLKQIGPNGAGGFAAAPVSSNNIHGSIHAAVIVGSGASRVLYTSDEDYQSDPATGAATEWNSVWRYDIGNGPLPWSNAPNRKLMSPYLTGFAGQNQKIEVVGNYLYANQRRANATQHDVYIVDLNNLQDPGTFIPGSTPWGAIWTSQGESLAQGFSDDALRDTMAIAVSPDGKWFAAIIAGGSAAITAPDGSSATTVANDVYVMPLTNGIPNIPARQVFRIGGASLGRDLTFDAAHNLYWCSSGLACVQSLDLGESTEATTSSDGTFSLSTPATQVSVAATTSGAGEQGPTPGVFTITRTPEDIGNPVTVFYTVTGTASNGVDYAVLTNRVTIAAGQTSTNITVTPIDDSLPELTETVVLSVRGSGGYSVGFPLSATVFIADNETPQLQILSLSTNIYQGTTNDYGALRIRRLGDTNVALVLDASSFAFGGTAVSNVDYYLANLPFSIDAGVVDSSNNVIYPGLAGSSAVGSRSIVLTHLAGGGYTVTNNIATATLTLKSVPPEIVLYSNNFESDPTGTAWDVFYGTYTNASTDYNVLFDYDYTSGSVGNLSPIPAAPHSTSGDTKGLYMTVNKSDSLGVAAGLNLYLKNHNFGSNFAMRFDMFLVRNSSGTAQSQVENAIFGINHSGTRTNWFRNAATGTSLPGSPTLSDGLWFDIGADGNGGGGANTDFGAWSAPTYTNGVNVIGPTNFFNRLANTTRQIFKKPPFDAGPAAGGSPANTVVSPTPTWVEVEVSQVGNVITWKINNTVILSYVNTPVNTAAYTNGAIMLGYNDPWDDIGNSSASSGEAGVIYDNLRVVSILPPTITTQPSSIVAPAGTATNLSVVATTVSGTTTYQWLRNGTNLVGEAGVTLSFPSLAFTNFGTYAVIVGDGAYSSQSSNVTVLPPTPAINTPPSSRAALLGSTLTPAFSTVATTYSGRTNYQWYTNTPTGLIATRTNATLSLTNVQSASFRPYFVTVSDGFTSVTSAPVSLTLAAQPTISAPSLTGTSFALSYTSEIGPFYVVDFKSALTNAAWTPISTNAGTGGIINVNDTTTGDQGYYRIRLQ